MARCTVPAEGPGLPDSALLEAQQRAKLKIKDCLPSIIEKLSATEKCSLIFLCLDRPNLISTGHTLCQYSYAGRDISDYIWRGSSGNVDALLSSLFHICRYDLLEHPLGLCFSHSMEQVCLSTGGIEQERLALYKVFAALPQTAADALLAHHLGSWRSAGRCLEETFCRNLLPNNFMTLISELHGALTAVAQDRLASCLASFVSRDSAPSSSGGGGTGEVYPLPTSAPYGLCVIINVNSFVEPLLASEEV
ncbi:hypothetical protein FHG87_017639 [Trinorchestia longiramus]|nr:hypothetical protein FHG87_017639 [Trinorchestia longiramus]